MKAYQSFIKPLLDFILSLAGFVLLLPLFLIVSLFLMIANRGTPFFTQRRPGLQGRVFTLIKFKTMTDEKDADGNLLPDKDRLTRVGKIVRSTSLDELPQLLNVIKGDMSLVGPRPLLIRYLERYTPEQARRHEVKPGITGWAQVNGRNALSWEEKFQYDVEYVEKISFLFDLHILIRTLVKVVHREGISSEAAATMEEFKPERVEE
jgi:lipopolysaccharide/colanic/teichoic acid biosynthesis glycosyltransferase